MPRAFVTDHSEVSRTFKARAIFAGVFILLLLSALLARLAWLQIVEYAYFADLSTENRVRLMALPPNRGLIFDRNGVVLAENRPTFHLELIPEQVEDLDATIFGLSEIVMIREEDIEQFYTSLRTHRPFENISLRTRLTDEEVALLAVNRHRFPGVDIVARLSRHYPQGISTVHTIGYVGRISEKDLTRIDASNYRGTSHIGKTGLERYYEEELHGTVGQQEVEVNAEGRVLRVIDKVPPVPGKNLVLNIDMELQLLAEEMLGEFSGAVIVLDAKTGGVLAFVSKPGYDPNLFVHGISVKDYKALREGDEKPLFNRALYGQYPPGSTLKPFISLGGLESSSIGLYETIKCWGHYLLPGDKTRRKYRDWKKEGHGTVDFYDAISESCDVYYYELAHRMGIDRIHDFLDKFGFGRKTGIDLLGERSGLLPSRDWKKRVHSKVWYPGETLIAGIGQGYMLATPLQLAVATSALANKGKVVQPRLLREMRDADGTVYDLLPQKTSQIKLKVPQRWGHVDKGMRDVLRGEWGTARATGWGLKVEMAGKTGTAQVFGIAQDEEYDAETIARKLRDHALFIAFAPIKDPELAIAIIAENGEHGSAMAPIAREIAHRYLLEEAPEEKEDAK